MRQRLQKLMSAAGHCSRRQAEQLLRQGRVEVNGTIARLGDQADPETDLICVDGTPLAKGAADRVLLLNKPPGVISSCHDPQGRDTVLDLIPSELRRGLHPVGRLDADSRGALLLSNQGELTLKLTHPRYAHSKTYRVTVTGIPDHSKLERWRQGLELDGSRTLPASVKLLHSKRGHSTLEVILREGRNRQIRRIASLLGHSVLDLQRVAIAGLALGATEEGCWRQLSRREWQGLISSQAGEA